MRKFLGTLVIIAVVLFVVGLFRDWFSVSRESQPGETNVELKINKEKIREDAQAAKAKLRRGDTASESSPSE